MIRARRTPAGRRDEGAVAILTAILLVVLIGFAAIVVDVGSIFRVRNELQNAADSAALAGAQFLNGQVSGLTDAEAEVKIFAEKHFANSTQLEFDLNHIKIEFGHWYFKDNDDNLCSPAPCFHALPADEENASAINAVRVTGFRSEAHGANSPVVHFFAQLIGNTKSNVQAQAVAVGAGPYTSECAFPMVVPDCVIDPNLEECDFCMQFHSDGTDNAGWTTFDADSGGVGGPAVADLIRAACFDAEGDIALDPVTAECKGLCNNTTTVDDEIDVSNGNNMNTGKNNFCPVIQDILRRGVPNGPAQPFFVRVPVLADTGDESCDGAKFSGHRKVAGYATMEIFGAKCGNADDEVLAPIGDKSCEDPENPGAWPPSSEKYVVALLRCNMASTEPGGGGFHGTDTPKVRLVR